MSTPKKATLLLLSAGAIGVIVFSALDADSKHASALSRRLLAAENPVKQSTGARNGKPLTYTPSGELVRPTGFRRWIYVGAPLTPNDMNGGAAAFPEFHSVYVNPEAYDQFAETGKFPDGTVVVKELIAVGSKRAASGKGYFMGDFIGLEVAVKDKRRFGNEPGNWAYFSFGHEYPLKDAASIQSTANCSVCHSAGADDDFVFTQYYPVLRAAKARASAGN